MQRDRCQGKAVASPLLAASDGPSNRAAKGLTAAPQPPLALGSDAAERSTAGSAASLAAALLAACPAATAGPKERDAERWNAGFGAAAAAAGWPVGGSCGCRVTLTRPGLGWAAV